MPRDDASPASWQLRSIRPRAGIARLTALSRGCDWCLSPLPCCCISLPTLPMLRCCLPVRAPPSLPYPIAVLARNKRRREANTDVVLMSIVQPRDDRRNFLEMRIEADETSSFECLNGACSCSARPACGFACRHKGNHGAGINADCGIRRSARCLRQLRRAPGARAPTSRESRASTVHATPSPLPSSRHGTSGETRPTQRHGPAAGS